ncbi:LysR family transcriptional regulator [Kibdelosporangium phytohabitans]|uniref:LysR family transcriptional regulator n=1 Tax=Kibdelosporangium phytohabitans TaxID=860235 RepID=A0A0N9IEZ4_9PSEU|nr:LysR family transcriptional regulator [Kibdelosporangium phytohabitans]ALG13787.1 LysR family transcriptional regulator [Kibdelosporangium phytohabitans]MBE1467292.1 DNA-binding transcriptional LysR family regulator [Kibdelosporangium phytohabitans]
MLDVRRMQVLRAVVTSGSVTSAAGNLGYTPSAISQQLAVLEKEAGVALLERVGRGVRATPAGRLLTEHAAIISKNLTDAESALRDLREGKTGQLSIRYFSTAGVALVPPAMAQLRRDHPGVQIDLKLIDPEDPLPEVEEGRADVAIVVFPRMNPPRKGVRLIHLMHDPLRAVLPKGHRLASKRYVDLADLAEEPWISTEFVPGPCADLMMNACAAAGFTPNVAVESEDYTTSQGFVAAGLGVALIPRLGLDATHLGVVAKRVRRPEPVREIYAAIRDSSAQDPAVQAFLTALTEVTARITK